MLDQNDQHLSDSATYTSSKYLALSSSRGVPRWEMYIILQSFRVCGRRRQKLSLAAPQDFGKPPVQQLVLLTGLKLLTVEGLISILSIILRNQSDQIQSQLDHKASGALPSNANEYKSL
ncbi:hypothetical protein FRC15_012046 [Serendipita sp. 397]|nr:hypothetical protein FRC15_012046 [Serendipita sp. 397]